MIKLEDLPTVVTSLARQGQLSYGQSRAYLRELDAKEAGSTVALTMSFSEAKQAVRSDCLRHESIQIRSMARDLANTIDDAIRGDCEHDELMNETWQQLGRLVAGLKDYTETDRE